MDIGKYNNEITELPDISEDMYENIFKVYTIKEDKNSPYYFFNILNKIDFPESLDSSLYETIDLNTKLPWTTLSYKIYGSQFLWWVIFLLNKPKNIFYAEPGVRYKYILPQYIPLILENINTQLGKYV
jgi:hypothetical protein